MICRECNSEFVKGVKYPARKTTCDNCMSNYYRRWREKNPDRYIENQLRARGTARHRNKKSSYGLSEAQYDEFMSRYDTCEICNRPFEGVVKHLDHDHKTGKHRGVLCSNCNTGLGLYKDNPEMLRKAAEYLEERN